MRVIAIGDNCIDDYIHQGQKYVGGCSVNFSIYAKQLGAESAYLGAVGRDKNGTLILDTLKDRGVEVGHVHVLDGKTAVTEVALVDGDRNFLGYEEGVLQEFVLTDEDFAYIEQFDLVHTSVYGKIDKNMPKIADKTKICYDFGNKLEYNNLNMLLDCVDYAFFSYMREDDFIRDYLEQAKAHGPKCVVATLGSNGSIAYDGVNWYRQGIRKVEVVDTIGAGDSFIAGFSVAVLSGNSIQECLDAGARKAEETIMHFGSV